VRVYDARSGKERHVFACPVKMLYSLAFAPDGRTLAAAGGDPPDRDKTGVVLLLDLAEGKPVTQLQAHGHSASTVAFAPDGRTLATAGLEDGLKLWDLTTFKKRLSLKEAAEPNPCLAFSPDSRRLAVSRGDTVTIREVATGKEVLTLRDPAQQVAAVAFSPDGSRLATAGGDDLLGRGGGLKLWDLSSGHELLLIGTA